MHIVSLKLKKPGKRITIGVSDFRYAEDIKAVFHQLIMIWSFTAACMFQKMNRPLQLTGVRKFLNNNIYALL